MDLLLQTLSGVFEGFGLEYEGFSFPGLRLVALQGLAGFFVTENQETLFSNRNKNKYDNGYDTKRESVFKAGYGFRG